MESAVPARTRQLRVLGAADLSPRGDKMQEYQKPVIKGLAQAARSCLYGNAAQGQTRQLLLACWPLI